MVTRNMVITKSVGQTPTEQYLARLCDKTFLRLWAYPNPYKAEGKELCDLLVVFEDRVFLFFDRASNKFMDPAKDVGLQWKRWKQEAIDKQIATAIGARNHLLKYPHKVFLDAKCTIPLPVPINATAETIHKIVVAHGAEDACKAHSVDNVYGSLAISYGEDTDSEFPFFLNLDKRDICHVLDSFNLSIILQELNTIYDFEQYIVDKEAAIERYPLLNYCGEEDLLAHYLFNLDKATGRHRIGTPDRDSALNAVSIGEGEWQTLIRSAPYLRKKAADRVSRLWDDIIQRTGQNALDGTLMGDGNIFSRPSAIAEMAKEPRFMRRALSEAMIQAANAFPDLKGGMSRNTSLFPSFHDRKAYVFLQIRDDVSDRQQPDYREKRLGLLQVACGAAKLHRPDLKLVVGIGVDAPKYSRHIAEDFIFMQCDRWTSADRRHYEELNEPFAFIKTAQLRSYQKTAREFPLPPGAAAGADKIGRNDLCPCGSGRKFKKCCRR